MSNGHKKSILRGSQMEDFEQFEELEAPQELDREVQELEEIEEDPEEGLDALDDEPLPDNTEEEENGDWIYHLQHPLDDGSRVPAKIRIPKCIYAKDIRNSSRGKTPAEGIFYMVASVAKIRPHILDKLDARDYMVVSALMNRRSLGNSRSVLTALEGKGR